MSLILPHKLNFLFSSPPQYHFQLGLSCATHIVSIYYFSQVTVFDTRRLRPGGRCSSRYPNDRPAKSQNSKAAILGSHVIDHAAQILTVKDLDSDKAFSKQVKEWEEQGILHRFPDKSVCEIQKGKSNDSPIIKSIKCPSGRVKWNEFYTKHYGI